MPRRTDAPQRLLATVLFTDIVGSTELAAKLGDRGWRHLIGRHHTYVRKMLKRYGGREVDTAGDGFFATFDQPANAIRCATELVGGLRRLGIEIRAGVHMGEVEVIGPKVGGIAVHIASRVMSKAGPGEIIVSSTVRDLTAGSDVTFADRGVQELKGVPAQWHLFAVEGEPAEALPEEPIPREPDSRRRLTVPMVATGIVVAAAAVTAVALFSRAGSDSFSPAPNTVARINPDSGKVIGGTALGTQPEFIVFDQSSGIWVTNFGARTVQRVDPKTTTASPAFGGLNGNPTGMAVGGGFTWVTTEFGGTLSKIDPETNLAQAIDLGTGVKGVAFGDGSVWVANVTRSTILRIDVIASAEPVTIRLPAGTKPAGIAVGEGSVWVADEVGSRVLQIDVKTNRVEGTGTPILGGHPEQVAFGAGFVWVANTDADSVTRIDPKTGEAVTIKDVGNAPYGIAAGAEGVWVANSLDGTLVRIEPTTAKVARKITLGYSPRGVALGDGSVWVTIQARS